MKKILLAIVILYSMFLFTVYIYDVQYIKTVKQMKLSNEILGAENVEEFVVRVIEIDSKDYIKPSSLKWTIYETNGNEKTLKVTYEDYNVLIPTIKRKDFISLEPGKMIFMVNGKTINLIQMIFLEEFKNIFN